MSIEQKSGIFIALIRRIAKKAGKNDMWNMMCKIKFINETVPEQYNKIKKRQVNVNKYLMNIKCRRHIFQATYRYEQRQTKRQPVSELTNSYQYVLQNLLISFICHMSLTRKNITEKDMMLIICFLIEGCC